MQNHVKKYTLVETTTDKNNEIVEIDEKIEFSSMQDVYEHVRKKNPLDSREEICIEPKGKGRKDIKVISSFGELLYLGYIFIE